jgi:hypothetical protein
MLEKSSTVQHLLRRGRIEGIAIGLLSGERKQFMQTAQPGVSDALPTRQYGAGSAASVEDIPATHSYIEG